MKNGAEFMINYKEEKDIVKKVKEITGPDGVAAVFDSTGKDQFDNDLEVVARKGTVVSYGNSVRSFSPLSPFTYSPSHTIPSSSQKLTHTQSGAVPPLTIARLSSKNIKVLRPTLFNYIYTREEFERYTAELFAFITKDKLNVRIHDTYKLEDIQKAHGDLEGRRTTGKLLVRP